MVFNLEWKKTTELADVTVIGDRGALWVRQIVKSAVYK